MIFYCESQDRGPAQLLACYADVGSVWPSIERTRDHPQEAHLIFSTKIFSLFDIKSRQWLYQLYQRLESKLDLANRWSSEKKRNGSLHKRPNLDEQLFATLQLLSLLNSGKDLRKPIITMLISLIHSSDGLAMRRKQLFARSPASSGSFGSVVIGRNISGVGGGGVGAVRSISDSNDGRENDKQINIIIQVRRFHS
jgi:hypothetical protein